MNGKDQIGIVSTTSGGKVLTVSVVWNQETAADRTLDIYGSNTPYTSAADLYNKSQGTKIGSITKSGETTTVTVEGDYYYVGLRSNKSAMYLDSITIEWDGSEAPEPEPEPEPEEMGMVTIAKFLEAKDNFNIYTLCGTVSDIVMDKNDPTQYNVYGNFNITDSTVGIDLRLPNTPTAVLAAKGEGVEDRSYYGSGLVPDNNRGSDQGDEDTLVENLSFSDITMDRVFYEPVYINLGEYNRCEGVRNLYFTNIHAFAAHMPAVIGRENCHAQNIYFTNCHFNQIDRASIPDEKVGPHCGREHTLLPYFRFVDNLVLNQTVFNIH